MSATAIAAERVEKGAALLDQRVPGWDQQIELYRLSIASIYNCILGQLYGDYGYGYRALNLGYEGCTCIQCQTNPSPGLPGEFGFVGTNEVSDRTLTTAWKRLIRKRGS